MIASRRSLWNCLFGRRFPQADDGIRHDYLTWANGITLARAALVSALLVVAIVEESRALLLWGLAASLALDFLDGQVARFLKTETVTGAQFDGYADRLATALVAIGVISMDNGLLTVVAVVAVLVQFLALDHWFASQFLHFREIWSPDHFHLLGSDGERVWWMHWSPAAKLASNLSIVLLAVGAWWAALGLAGALIAVRLRDFGYVKGLVRAREREIDQLRLAGHRERAGGEPLSKQTESVLELTGAPH